MNTQRRGGLVGAETKDSLNMRVYTEPKASCAATESSGGLLPDLTRLYRRLVALREGLDGIRILLRPDGLELPTPPRPFDASNAAAVAEACAWEVDALVAIGGSIDQAVGRAEMPAPAPRPR